MLPIDESFSPLLHRIESAVRHRAVQPDNPILESPEILTKFAHPDEELVKNSASLLENLISKADVKKGNYYSGLTNGPLANHIILVPPKTKGRKRQRETEKPLSGLDVDALLNQEPKRANISPDNAIPEFKQMLSRAENIETIIGAVKQLCAIIESQIKNSLGDANYDRVVEELGTLRDELVDYEEPALYNDFLRSLKSKMLLEELGGDRRELWWLLRRSKIGLIDRKASDRSEVSEEEAKEVSKSTPSLQDDTNASAVPFSKLKLWVGTINYEPQARTCIPFSTIHENGTSNNAPGEKPCDLVNFQHYQHFAHRV